MVPAAAGTTDDNELPYIAGGSKVAICDAYRGGAILVAGRPVAGQRGELDRRAVGLFGRKITDVPSIS